jgi:hypothetical protein
LFYLDYPNLAYWQAHFDCANPLWRHLHTTEEQLRLNQHHAQASNQTQSLDGKEIGQSEINPGA